VFQHGHGRPRCAVVRAALEHEVDVLLADARIISAVFPRLGESDQGAVWRGLNGRNAIHVVAVFSGDKDIRMAEQRLGLGAHCECHYED